MAEKYPSGTSGRPGRERHSGAMGRGTDCPGLQSRRRLQRPRSAARCARREAFGLIARCSRSPTDAAPSRVAPTFRGRGCTPPSPTTAGRRKDGRRSYFVIRRLPARGARERCRLRRYRDVERVARSGWRATRPRREACGGGARYAVPPRRRPIDRGGEPAGRHHGVEAPAPLILARRRAGLFRSLTRRCWGVAIAAGGD